MWLPASRLKSITVDKDNYVYYADSYGLVEKITNIRIATIAVPNVVQKTPYIIISTAAVSVLIIASCHIARKKSRRLGLAFSVQMIYNVM